MISVDLQGQATIEWPGNCPATSTVGGSMYTVQIKEESPTSPIIEIAVGTNPLRVAGVSITPGPNGEVKLSGIEINYAKLVQALPLSNGHVAVDTAVDAATPKAKAVRAPVKVAKAAKSAKTAKPAKETKTTDTEVKRSYARMPEDFKTILSQTSSPTALAEHFGVPVAKINGWKQTVKRQDERAMYPNQEIGRI